MYVIGIIDQQELADLRARGWEAEKPPASLIPEWFKPDPHAGLHRDPTNNTYFVQFFVDSDLFAVMTGPDWEGPSQPETAPAAPL